MNKTEAKRIAAILTETATKPESRMWQLGRALEGGTGMTRPEAESVIAQAGLELEPGPLAAAVKMLRYGHHIAPLRVLAGEVLGDPPEKGAKATKSEYQLVNSALTKIKKGDASGPDDAFEIVSADLEWLGGVGQAVAKGVAALKVLTDLTPEALAALAEKVEKPGLTKAINALK